MFSIHIFEYFGEKKISLFVGVYINTFVFHSSCGPDQANATMDRGGQYNGKYALCRTVETFIQKNNFALIRL